MNSFFIQLLYGVGHSLALGFEAIILYVPLAIMIAFIFKNEQNIFSRGFLYFLDVFIALPNQLLLLTLAALLGGTWGALLVAIGVTQMPGIIRHIRVYIIRAYLTEHVEATRALGASNNRVIFKHVLPRLSGPVTVISLTLLKRAILSEALLTFLGLGFDPLTPSLGRLLAEGKAYLYLEPARFFLPVGVLFILLVTLQTLGDRFSSLFKLRGIRYL